MNVHDDDLVPGRDRAEAAGTPGAHDEPAGEAGADDLVPSREPVRRGWRRPASGVAPEEADDARRATDGGRRPPDVADLLAGGLRAVHGLSPAGWRLSWVEWDVWTLAWVLVVLPLCVLFADSAIASTVVGLALFRAADVIVDRARSLVDPAGGSAAGRRGIVLGGLHLAELAMVVAVVHRWQTGAAAGISLVVGFDTVTFRGPSLFPGNWVDFAVVLGTAGALVVLTTVAYGVVTAVRERW